MNNIVAVFNNRTSTALFSRMLKSQNVPNMIISTPKGIGALCGVSVSFPSSGYAKAQWILSSYDFKFFYGFYVEDSSGYINKYYRI